MKKFIASMLVICVLLTSGAFAANVGFEGLMITTVGSMISNYGVYNDFDGGSLYLQTLAEIVDNHPELYTETMKIMLSAKDKYGQYYTAEEGKQLLQSLSDNIEGIGVSITLFDGNLIVSQVLKGTPAESAGIKEGDIIIAADGRSLLGMDIDVATSYIKGEKGTKVNVTVRRNGEELTFPIVRSVITTSPVEYKIIDDKVGYVQITSFSKNTATYFREAMGAFDKEQITDIVIDVRNNGGGYLSEAVAVADYILPSGKIITSEDHKMDILDKEYIATGPVTPYEVVVLINEYSASASEVLCAALVENGAAVAIGQTSYGKGTVQEIRQLPDGGLMKYTTAFYLTPQGRNIEGIGIDPDFEVKNVPEKIDLSQFTELKYKNTYSVGMSNPEIKYTKEMLKHIGIYHGEVNEYFDESLKIAVMAIQKATEFLPQTGVLDPVTQIEILEVMHSAEIMADTQLDTAIEYLLK